MIRTGLENRLSWSPKIDADEWFYGLATDWRVLRDSSRDCAQATRAIVAENRGCTSDETPGPIFWMALARLQWLDGCLDPTVKNKALRHVRRGAEKIDWLTPRSHAKRQLDLERLAEMLQSPLPAPKPFGTRPLAPCSIPVRTAFRVPSKGLRTFWLVIVKHRRLGRRYLPECVVAREPKRRGEDWVFLGYKGLTGDWEVTGRDVSTGRPCSTILVPDLDQDVHREFANRKPEGLQLRFRSETQWPREVKWDGVPLMLASMRVIPITRTSLA